MELVFIVFLFLYSFLFIYVTGYYDKIRDRERKLECYEAENKIVCNFFVDIVGTDYDGYGSLHDDS